MSIESAGDAGSHDPYGAGSSTGAEISKVLARVALGWFLLHQGWGKLQQELGDGLGTFYRSGSYQNNLPGWLPNFIAAPYAYALPWVEFVFGGLLIAGLANRISAGVSTLIFLSILVAWLNAGNLLPRHMLMIYTPLAAYFYFTGPGRYSLDAVMARRSTGETP